MMPENLIEDIVSHLRHVSLFRSLPEDELIDLATMFRLRTFDENHILYEEGDEPRYFYLVYSGEIELYRGGLEEDEEDEYPKEVVSIKHTDDFFGEFEIHKDTLRYFTARTTEPSTVLVIPADQFADLIDESESIYTHIVLADQAYQPKYRKRLQQFLEPKEEVSVVLGKHWSWLLFRGGPALAIGLILMGTAGWLYWWIIPLPWYIMLLPVALLCAAVWAFLWLDYNDDIYAVTNRRVIAAERIALINDQRIEAPLHMIRAIQVKQTFIEKALGYGDVTIQTFTGAIIFRDVPAPNATIDFIREMQERAQIDRKIDDEQTLQRRVREGIGWEVDDDKEAPQQKEPEQVPLPPPPRRRGFLSFLGKFLPRFYEEHQDEIIIRKHWLVLTWDLGISLLGFPTLLILGLLPIFGIGAEIFNLICGVLTFLAALLIGWTWFQYEDWRNDIYSISPTKVVDAEKSPLGLRSQQRVAPIDSILNVRYSRPNLFANLFNYGTITIQTGGDTGELTFNWVRDPVNVQQLIFRYMEEHRLRQEKQRQNQMGDDIVKWLRAYTDVANIENPIPFQVTNDDSENNPTG